MSEPPTLDGRDRAAVRAAIEANAATYTDRWEPESGGPGAAVVELFAAMADDLLERVDQLPEKHRVAFFETLGFGRRPPQAATVPVAFEVAADANRNVPIPPGTTLSAEPNDEELDFRLGRGDAFEATPARLREVYCVDPADDRITRHDEVVDGAASSTLFSGENRQRHALYVGHPERLDVSGPATIQLEVEADDPAALGRLVWEFHGESGPDGEGWHELTREDPGRQPFTFSLGCDEELTETDRNGIETYWVRARMEEFASTAFDIELDSLRFGRPKNDAPVDGMYANDVPQSTGDGPIYPFGTMPRQRDTFYLRSDEAITKRGAEVTIRFEGVEAQTLDQKGVDEVGFSWEYFDGNAWRGLDPEADMHCEEDFPRSLQFQVPEDLEMTAVAGQDGAWIRGRLIAGEFVEVRHVGVEEPERKVVGDPPTIDSLRVSYTYPEAWDDAPAHLLTENNLVFEREDVPFRPFRRLPDDAQTMYLGFEGTLAGGPIQLYVDAADLRYAPEFTPRTRWEYRVEHGWQHAPGTDESVGATESGIVSLHFPTPSAPQRRFGRERHWLRMRVRGDAFGATVSANDSAIEATTGLSACRERLTTPGGAVEETTDPPTISGLHPNVGEVANVTVIEDETLGSSDGSPNTTLSVAEPPVLDSEVWIDESQSLTASARHRLETTDPERVSIETDADGEITAVWVRWKQVGDFLASGEDDRHYVLDPIEGTVRFGDDRAGRIPPHGSDNIRATYRTGGGEAGNVASGEIDELVSGIALVEDVINPVAGGGGAAGETTGDVLDRAPGTIRDRDRAVTAADFERIALDASRHLAAVTCIPGLNEAGERAPGWVTLVVVPADRRPAPVPSPALRDTVEREVRTRSPAPIIGEGRLVVRGPSYVAVGTDATIVAEPDEGLGTVEARIEDRLTSYLHPVTGAEGDGWAFGELPSVSDLFAIVEATAGVDHVRTLRLRYRVGGEDITVVQGEAPPEGAPDLLTRNGQHELVVEPFRGGR